MADTPFGSIIDKAKTVSDKMPLRGPDDWMQGRTVYGGMVAAMSLKSMHGHVPQRRKVRSLLFSFVGPLDSNPFTIQTQPLRSGKSVTTIESKIIQNNKICCMALGSFGADRGSMIGVAPMDRPEMLEPSEAFELPYIEGITPTFTHHFDYRWAIGDLPFSGKGGKEIGGWINFREETSCLTEEWLVALADA